MRNRRYLASSDDEDDDAPPQPSPKEPVEMRSSQRKRKRMKIYEDDDEDEEEAIKQAAKTKRDKKKPKDDEEEEKEVSPPPEDDEEEEVPVEDAKPIGEVVRVSGKGKARRNHYKSFEFDGLSYELTSNPWPVKDQHPDLETAAIVLQFPSGKRESLKQRDLETESDCLTPNRVNVVVPSGNHGLPDGEGGGPSPLLDRWRKGGGCDCGGWDMGCPLVVFGNHNMKTEENQPVEIFLKGTKEKTPALTMKLTEGGQYTVDFHAQLSSLQAFSICVAILHGTEASIVVGGYVKRKILQCDSLRVFIEDEVKHLIEAVAEGQKGKSSKNLDEIPPCFVVNPPFSPMSRA